MQDVIITIENGIDNPVIPVIKDEIEWEIDRIGAPSQLTFTVIKDDNISFKEGDMVKLYYKEQPLFCGYVFSKERDKLHQIEVTAYDQIRYLQNKYSYVFTKKTASQIVEMLCKDFGVKTGVIEDTGYVIPSLIEDDQSALDIILEALDETLVNTGEMYVLYDNFGSLELRNIAHMKSDMLIDKDTAENFSYTSSIDDETYNKIVLYYVEEDTNDRIPYVAKDDNNISKWGLLQYYEEVSQPSIGQNKADSLLQLYNKPTRELEIEGAFGNPLIRGGCLVVVQLDLGDVITSNYMLVDKVTHNFKNDLYTMDLTLLANLED